MSTITTLEKLLEADKVASEAVYHCLDAFRGEERVERLGYGWGSVSEAAATGHRGVVPADAVWGRVGPFKVESEGSGRDLVIVLRVAPSTEPRFGIRIKEGRSREIINIWRRENEYSRVIRSFPKEGRTFGPVPVRLGSRESTFFLQSTFEPVNERTMPREEMPREVDLANRSQWEKE